MDNIKICVCGAGTMGSGIAQVAALAGFDTIQFDVNSAMLEKSKAGIGKNLQWLLDKEKISAKQKDQCMQQLQFTDQLADCVADIIIEAIIEKKEVKSELFSKLAAINADKTIFATNTSSIAVMDIASSVPGPGRVVGMHFFNPAPIMKLVEVIKTAQTDASVSASVVALATRMGKTAVICKDSPGFIVNRVARHYYLEAMKLVEDGYATIETIDSVMESTGFKMGPFKLMDLIGNDINYTVTETVWKQFFYDPKYKPSLTQKRMVESGRLGKKSGRGYYDYSEGEKAEGRRQKAGNESQIFFRVLVMLINEAADALYYGVATKEDIDLAMTKGVNYPKGLLKWADEIGIKKILSVLEDLYNEYNEDRYRPSVLLKKMVKEGKIGFYS